MTSITLIFPYYKNPMMLRRQMAEWATYGELADRTELIVVDDGSPVGSRAEEVLAGSQVKNLRLFRIVCDIPWNQGQARNLGVKNSAHEWVAWIDIDHLVTRTLLNEILTLELDPLVIYAFTRIKHIGRAPNNPHREIRLMTKQTFWAIGGFDEAFSGHYGYVETEFFTRPSIASYMTVTIPVPLERCDDDYIPDCKTFGLTRKEGRDVPAYEDIREWKKKNGIGVELFKLPWKEIAL